MWGAGLDLETPEPSTGPGLGVSWLIKYIPSEEIWLTVAVIETESNTRVELERKKEITIPFPLGFD